MGGADHHATERALENRRKAAAETYILYDRYGLRSGLSYKLAQGLSLSLVDQLIVAWRNLTWKGKYATEI